jgi:two-component system sensor histidine kinase KdpD
MCVQAVAVWTYEHNRPAGRGSDTLPGARIRYQPLDTANGVVGVMGVKPGEPGNYLTPDQRQLLDAYANLAAIAIERNRLSEQANQAEILEATEKLQTALLNSISHDLRTPLVSITGVLDSLLEAEQANDGELVLEKPARVDLLQTAREESARLNRLVANLLDMTRLEAGALKIYPQPADIEDVIGAALGHLKEKLQDHPVRTFLPENLPAVMIDFVLIDQVLVNLLDNATKYSSPGKPINIRGRVDGKFVELSVIDQGVGIPPEDLNKVFDKFYRVQRKEDAGGTGLGLSICKGIVEAHGGRIWAENRPGGGAIFYMTLPVSEVEEAALPTKGNGRT